MSLDYSFQELRCPKCTVLMRPAGVETGPRIDSIKKRCDECDITILIIPVKKEYAYEVVATTQEERTEEKVRKAMEANELELARTVTRIREEG